MLIHFRPEFMSHALFGGVGTAVAVSMAQAGTAFAVAGIATAILGATVWTRDPKEVMQKTFVLIEATSTFGLSMGMVAATFQAIPFFYSAPMAKMFACSVISGLCLYRSGMKLGRAASYASGFVSLGAFGVVVQNVSTLWKTFSETGLIGMPVGGAAMAMCGVAGLLGEKVGLKPVALCLGFFTGGVVFTFQHAPYWRVAEKLWWAPSVVGAMVAGRWALLPDPPKRSSTP